MSHIDPQRLRSKMSGHDDRTLTAVLTVESATYSPEAIAAAEAELAARGMAKERLEEFRLYRYQLASAAATADLDDLLASGTTPQDLAAAGDRQVNIGVICIIAGVAITVWSYIGAAPGETYIVTWGAILFGVSQVLRGVDGRRKAKRAADQGVQ